MKHIDDIKDLIRTLRDSSKFHALVIESPPGWAKSTTVDGALAEMKMPFHMLGAYSTALQLYNALCDFSDSIIVIDDCAGLFGHPSAMAILKAATWSSAGSNGHRVVTWRSSSDKVASPRVEFRGKLILLTNSIPCGTDTDAFLSRTLFLSIEFSPLEVEEMLLEAARSGDHYEDTDLATKVAWHLISNFSHRDMAKLNLRTLHVGYELARLNPHTWTRLLERLMPPTAPEHLVRKLGNSSALVEDQAKEFSRTTGLSRRTFFTYRKAMGIRKLNSERFENGKSADCTGMRATF